MTDRPAPAPHIVFEAMAFRTCPLCSGLIAGTQTGVIHSDPVCPLYAASTGDEFAAAIAALNAPGGAA